MNQRSYYHKSCRSCGNTVQFHEYDDSRKRCNHCRAWNYPARFARDKALDILSLLLTLAVIAAVSIAVPKAGAAEVWVPVASSFAPIHEGNKRPTVLGAEHISDDGIVTGARVYKDMADSRAAFWYAGLYLETPAGVYFAPRAGLQRTDADTPIKAFGFTQAIGYKYGPVRIEVEFLMQQGAMFTLMIGL